MTADISITEATDDYIVAYNEYVDNLYTLKESMNNDTDVYRGQLYTYFNSVLTEYTIEVRGKYIFIRTLEEINKEVLDKVKEMNTMGEVEFEINFEDDVRTLLIYIDSIITDTEEET